MLTKHIPNLAASRNVPVLYIRDHKRASLRLGELVKLKTALAIGVKARGNDLNLLLQQILTRDDTSWSGFCCVFFSVFVIYIINKVDKQIYRSTVLVRLSKKDLLLFYHT